MELTQRLSQTAQYPLTVEELIKQSYSELLRIESSYYTQISLYMEYFKIPVK